MPLCAHCAPFSVLILRLKANGTGYGNIVGRYHVRFSDNFMELCFVENPLYDKDSQLGDHACEMCSTVKTVTQFTAQSMKRGPLPGAAFTEPVLVKVVHFVCCCVCECVCACLHDVVC